VGGVNARLGCCTGIMFPAVFLLLGDGLVSAGASAVSLQSTNNA